MPPSSPEPVRAKRARPSEAGILRHAERVFSERGYAATPLRDLIKESGCSTTAFYARFDSKEAVLEALTRRLIDDLYSAAMKALPAARDVDEAYEVGIEVLRAKLRGRRGLWRVVLTEGAHTPRTRPLVRDAHGALASLLAAQLNRAGSADAEPLAWAIVGTLSLHLTRWAVFEELTAAELVAALRATARTLMPKS